MSKRQVSVYLDESDIKKAKTICLDLDIRRVNEFYEKAIKDAIEKALEGQVEMKLN